MSKVIRLSDELKDRLTLMGSKSDTYEDIIKRNIDFVEKFTNEREFDDWFADNYHLFGFDEIVASHRFNCDYVLISGEKRISVELETLASNFFLHKHDPAKIDLVICLSKDKDLPIPVVEITPFEFVPVERGKKQITFIISDKVDVAFRTKVASLGGKKGDLAKYLEEAINLWLSKDVPE